MYIYIIYCIYISINYLHYLHMVKGIVFAALRIVSRSQYRGHFSWRHLALQHRETSRREATMDWIKPTGWLLQTTTLPFAIYVDIQTNLTQATITCRVSKIEHGCRFMTILFWRRLKEYPQGPSNLSFMFDHYLVVILFQKCWLTRKNILVYSQTMWIHRKKHNLVNLTLW